MSLKQINLKKQIRGRRNNSTNISTNIKTNILKMFNFTTTTTNNNHDNNDNNNPLGIVQEIEIWPYEQVVYKQPGIPTKIFWVLRYKQITYFWPDDQT